MDCRYKITSNDPRPKCCTTIAKRVTNPLVLRKWGPLLARLLQQSSWLMDLPQLTCPMPTHLGTSQASKIGTELACLDGSKSAEILATVSCSNAKSSGCDAGNSAWKRNIKEAYDDAHKLVSDEEIKEHLDFNSAAAFEFLGPSGLNKGEQSQIQAVFANVATVYEGSSPYTPNWIRVSHISWKEWCWFPITHTTQARCDDPMKYCTRPKEDPPKCPPQSATDVANSVVFAYVRNPFHAGNDRFSEINFCPEFFDLRNLGNAMAYGSAPSHPVRRSDLETYQGRGMSPNRDPCTPLWPNIYKPTLSFTNFCILTSQQIRKMKIPTPKSATCPSNGSKVPTK